jgi:hypothetical protein
MIADIIQPLYQPSNKVQNLAAHCCIKLQCTVPEGRDETSDHNKNSIENIPLVT